MEIVGTGLSVHDGVIFVDEKVECGVDIKPQDIASLTSSVTVLSHFVVQYQTEIPKAGRYKACWCPGFQADSCTLSASNSDNLQKYRTQISNTITVLGPLTLLDTHYEPLHHSHLVTHHPFSIILPYPDTADNDAARHFRIRSGFLFVSVGGIYCKELQNITVL